MESLLPRTAGDWEVVNDDVMGGCSTARMLAVEEHLRFAGEVSLANGGGFASVRAPLVRGMEGARGLHLQVRGDGRRYQVRLRADTDSSSVAWRHSFATDGGWQTIALDLSGFEPVIRGRRVTPAKPLAAADMAWIGFMTAEKRAGGFHLDIGACMPIL
jgi:monofunctional biosynthetic peptidoglycan transglycosylase